MIQKITVDASVALAWFLPDSEDRLAYAAAVHDGLVDEKLFCVQPAIFAAEVSKRLRLAYLNKHITKAKAIDAGHYIDQLIGQVVAEPASIERVLSIAIGHHIQAYDTAYLLVAREKGGNCIATLDGGMQAGARALQIRYWQPA